MQAGKRIRFRPSSAGRWMRCTASVPFIESLGDIETGGAAAEEGTRAHAVAEEAILFGRAPDRNSDEWAMYEILWPYIKHCRSLMSQEGSIFAVEKKLTLLSGSVEGTADFCHYNRDTGVAVISDLKFGFTPVDPVENAQLMTYAAAWLLQLEMELDYHYWPQIFILEIHQPRAYGGGPRTYSVTAARVRAWGEQVLRTVLDVESGLWNFVPGFDTCMWCPARPYCTPARSQALQIAGVDLLGAVDVEDFNEAALTDDQLTNILTNESSLKKLVDSAVREAYRRKRNDPQSLPRLKFVATLGYRQWRDEDETAAVLLADAPQIPEDALYHPRKLKSPAQVENLLEEHKCDGLRPKDPKFTDLFTRYETGGKLVPVTDHRPEIGVGDFDDLLETGD